MFNLNKKDLKGLLKVFVFDILLPVIMLCAFSSIIIFLFFNLFI